MRKRSFVLCLLSIGSVSFAAEQELCEVGVTEISSSLSNTIVAVSYDDLGGGSGMNVSNLVKTTNLTAGDTLAVFNDSKTYDTWVLTAGAGDAKFWAKQAKTFTVGADGQLAEGTGQAAADAVLGVGTGLWLTRQDVSKPFYIYGRPASARSVTVAANSWTLVGNPTQTDRRLEADWMSTVAVNGDQVVMPGPDGRLWYYSYRTKKGWRTTKADGSWDSTPPVIGAGLGFWIRLTKGGTIEW